MSDLPISAGLLAAGGFRSSAATHPGARRTENQDACLNRPDLGLWAVTDGAGGHSSGALAARAVVAALDAIPPGLTGAELLAQVRQRVGGAHATLRREAAKLGQGTIMASTVVVLIIRDGHFACLWAGDSRAYRLQDGALQLLTQDHSVVQALIASGSLAAAEAEAHPQANVITRAIGAEGDDPELDKVSGRVKPDDVFLLCTDGIWKTLEAPELLGLLTATATAPPAERLLSAALARAAADNVTAVVVEVAAGPENTVG